MLVGLVMLKVVYKRGYSLLILRYLFFSILFGPKYSLNFFKINIFQLRRAYLLNEVVDT
jgi:hypothetical protein